MSVRIPLMILLCISLSAGRSYAQMPTLSTQGEENAIALQRVNIDVRVNGNIATTNWTMTFRNKTNRVLEGELTFPLGDGITVSRYALDINGVLREGVPVEKAKATTVLEALETRRIDPGILEKVDGNSFRTRIYPIAAFNKRIVAVGYDQELQRNRDKSFKYFLPLIFTKRIDTLSVRIVVNGSDMKPEPGSGSINDISFKEMKHSFVAEKIYTDYKSSRPIVFNIPQGEKEARVVMQEQGNHYAFLLNTNQYDGERDKVLADSICILWDASLSSRFRNRNADLAFLDEYFSKQDAVVVSLAVFSNAVQSTKTFHIKKGQWTALKNALEEIVPDGATNLSAIDLKAIKCKEFFLFSDGRSTFGKGSLRKTTRPVYTITSSLQSDYPALQSIALNSGGCFINLVQQKPEEAVNSILTQPLMLLGIKLNSDVEEVYPSIPVAASKGVMLAGISYSPDNTIVLQYGYGNEVTIEKRIKLDAERYNVSGSGIDKIWAQKKLAELDLNYEENKSEIERLGQKYTLLTRNTSLMVLENLSDYLLYNIEPPEELRVAYDQELKWRGTRQTNLQQNRIAMSETSLNNLYNWWQKDHKTKPGKPAEKKTSALQQVSPNANQNRPGTSGIAGTLTDERGNPLVSATVITKQRGITRGRAVTDFDGNYTIKPLRPGIYDVTFSIRNVQQTITQVRVTADALATLNNRLNTANLPRAKEVIVRASRRDVPPLIDFKKPGGRFGVTAERIEKMPSTSNVDAASLGVQSYKTQNGSQVLLGGARGTATQYVVDGVIVNGNAPVSQGYNQVVSGSSDVPARYGETSGGVINSINTTQSSGITVGTISYDKSVLDELSKAAPDDQYKVYLELRKDRINVPAFYYNVAAFFVNSNRRNVGLKILSNLAELEMENYELYKMLGYKLRELKEPEAAADAFLKVVAWRPMDPQSLRDYALALEEGGHYQQALDTLYSALTNAIDPSLQGDYAGIEEVLITEINHLISKHNEQLNTASIKRSLIQPLPVDVRVVIAWNMKNTDIDLWVTDPSGEKCMYNHKQTAIGGTISADFRRGFGPEQFMVRNAIRGEYKIEVNYYGDNQVKLVGPTTVMAEIFTCYATGHEEKKVVALQMQKGDNGGVYFGSFDYK